MIFLYIVLEEMFSFYQDMKEIKKNRNNNEKEVYEINIVVSNENKELLFPMKIKSC
jgi:hypothetical protein